jgi:hypothetical protein
MGATLAPWSTGAQLSGDAHDPLDRVLYATHGEPLRVGGAVGGEYDSLAQVSTAVRRRLAGARLVSTDGGLRPDQLQHVAAGRLPGLADMNADEFVTWYVAECVAGLDYRACVRAGGVESFERPPELYADDDAYAEWVASCEADQLESLPPVESFGPAGSPPAAMVGTVRDAPDWFSAWVLRTVHPPKAALLVELGRWAFEGGPLPVVPDDVWAPALVVKFERRSGKRVG